MNHIKLIQITDTHIMDEGAPSFNDFDTSTSLHNVIDSLNKNDSDADFVLLTGDLVHEPTETAYRKLSEHLLKLTVPVFCLPGNHDIPEMMNRMIKSFSHNVDKIIKAENWLIILLDTCVIGEHRGELSSFELEFLRTTLESNSNYHCLIALHHHPVSIDSSWMDAMALTNAKDFLNIVDEHDHVRGIIWGHIHQEFELIRNNVTYLGTPSTSLQFTPNSEAFAVEDKPPAYRRLLLQTDGELETDVVYI